MTFFLATDNIPSDRSNPMISEASVFSANLIAKSPAGDLAIKFAEKTEASEIIGLDLSDGMLSVACNG